MATERRLHALPDPEPGEGTGAPDAARAASLDDLMASTARGSVIAFEKLYNQLAPAVYGIALRVTRDVHMAEDVAQEALVEVWRTASRYSRDRGTVRAWVLTIAHRRAVDRVRSEQARTERDRAHATPDPSQQQGLPETAVDRLFSQWEAARVAAGLNKLTRLQREALELAYYRGLTHREVAHELGVPLGTAKARLRDGLLSLKNMWEVES
jgi:RNA polymerase sigma-70 factor (ECF subfamily)